MSTYLWQETAARINCFVSAVHKKSRFVFALGCREAQLEKKAARREAAKEREQSPEISKLPGGGDIMGGDDSFAAAKAR